MPPIVVDRTTGSIISAPELTPAQRDTLWGEIIRAYVRKHPEVFEEEETTK
jgi:hypothetical protein